MTPNDRLTRRRCILTGTAVGTLVLAGCSSDDTDDQSGDEQESDGNGYSQDSSPEDSQYVESGEMVYPPSVEVHHIAEVTDDSVSLEMHAMPNPVDDYEVHLHYVPASQFESEWTVGNKILNQPQPEYSESEEEWSTDNSSQVLKKEYREFESNVVDTLTVPAEASGVVAENVSAVDDDYTGLKGVGDEYPFEGVPSHYEDAPVGAQLDSDTGFVMPYLVNFDIDADIPMFEPFVFVLTVEGFEGVLEDGSIVANTQEIVKTEDEGFVYPEYPTSASHSLPEWDTESVVRESVYGEDVTENHGDKTVRFCRSSDYGHYSNKYTEIGSMFDANMPEESFFGTIPLDYMNNAPVQNLWSVEVDITEEEYESALDKRSEIRSSPDDDLRTMINDPEVQNNPVVQDVAEQLSDICDNIGADQPIEQLRVVSDFVQYMEYVIGTDTPQYFGPGIEEVSPANKHPVQTLYLGHGDCVDFTILANTILSTDYFDINPEIAHFEKIELFSNDNIDLGHVATAIPMDELEINEVTDYHGIDFDREDYPDYPADQFPREHQFVPATMEHNGDTYLYIELTAPLPLGTVVGYRHHIKEFEEKLPAEMYRV